MQNQARVARVWLAMVIATWMHASEGWETLQPSAAVSLLDRYNFDRPDSRIALPRHLREVSGLANAGGPWMLLHDDNWSDVYRLNYVAPDSTATLWRKTKPRVHADFEGIALLGERTFLADSHGALYEVGADDGALHRTATGLEGQCGFEGLAVDAQTRTFYLPCKYPRFHSQAKVNVFAYRWQDGAAAQPIVVEVRSVLQSLGLQRLRPSAVEISKGGRLLVLAGKERVLLEIETDGTLIAWRRLGFFRHRQPEGLTIADNGDIIIADEGGWFRGLITVYRRGALGELP